MDDTSRICPTRTDGSDSLFAHRVTLPKCQERQRKGFHKCFRCVHNNSLQEPMRAPAAAQKGAEKNAVKAAEAARPQLIR